MQSVHATNACGIDPLCVYNSWVDDFAKLQVTGGPVHERWATEFAQQPTGRTASWNQIWDETAGPSNAWASEFGKAEAATVNPLGSLHVMLSQHPPTARQ